MTDSSRPPSMERLVAASPTIASIILAVVGATWWLSGVLFDMQRSVDRVGYAVESVSERVTRVEQRVERLTVRMPESWMSRRAPQEDVRDE